MSHTITISDTLYAKAQYLAQSRSQSVEDVIQSLLAGVLEQPRLGLPKQEQDELQALAFLTDETLLTIAREQMPSATQKRMSLLMEQNTQGMLSDDDRRELSDLVEASQRLTLRKAEAMKLLHERGYSKPFDLCI